MSYVYTVPDIVICPDAGCDNCEHNKPHKYMDVESSCEDGGDNNCPNCVPVKQG